LSGICGDAADDRGGRLGGQLAPAGAGPEVGHAEVAGLGGGGAKRAGEVVYLRVCLRGLPVVLAREPVCQPRAKRPL
jgi:hypothetical protein